MDNSHWQMLHEEMRIDLKEIRKDLVVIKIEIAMLKVKAGVWGSIGALIPLIIFYVLEKS